MSTTYAGSDAWATPVTLADDGDDAGMLIVAASFEATLDRTAWLRARMSEGGLIPFVSTPRVALAGTFDDSVFNGVHLALNAVSNPASFYMPIRLIDGLTLSAIVMYFLTNNGHGSLPTTGPTIKLARAAFTVGATLGTESIIGTGSYVLPANVGLYNANELRIVANTAVAGHVVDSVNYTYTLTVTDEAGGGAISGNDFFAYAVAYT
jgi:hypothetical protein